MGYINCDELRLERAWLRDIDAVLLARRQTQLRQIILDVLDEGDDSIPWGAGFNHPFGAIADDARLRFCDAVEKRMEKIWGV